jgi:folate-dependent phosphoribosylglycinamide formyltransferase PurN
VGDQERDRIGADDPSAAGMRIVFFTNEKFVEDEKFRYMFANVAAVFGDVHVVAVRLSRTEKKPFSLRGMYRKVRRIPKRARHLGIAYTLELLSSYPLQLIIDRRNWREVDEGLRALPRPRLGPEPEKSIYVDTVNGTDAVEAISKLKPDVIIQVNAGILRRQVFEIPRVGTLNLHPGIAPLIKGLHSIYWALWEHKREWMGSTLHFIDEGIDTGPVLAYAPVEPRHPGERFPPLFVRATELGVKRLVDALLHIAQGRRWVLDPPEGARVYRSTLSGWRLALLEIRLALRRRRGPDKAASHASEPWDP